MAHCLMSAKADNRTSKARHFQCRGHRMETIVGRNRRGQNFDRALIDAVLMGEAETVKQLLRWGADVNTRDQEHQETPLMLAKTETISRILLDNGADTFAVDDQGRTAFIKSLSLIDYQADMDINAQDQNGKTALITAVEMCVDEAIPWLLARGANVNIENQWGETALTLAESYGRQQIVEMLTKASAKTVPTS